MTSVVAVAHALVIDASPASEQHPAKVYVARLAPGSRRTMRHALDIVALLVTIGACDAETLDWASVRYQHTAVVRAALADGTLRRRRTRCLRRYAASCVRRGGSAR